MADLRCLWLQGPDTDTMTLEISYLMPHASRPDLEIIYQFNSRHGGVGSLQRWRVDRRVGQAMPKVPVGRSRDLH